MDNVILTSIPAHGLKDLIREALAEYLPASQEKLKAEIITRAELCKRLDISEPTAIRLEQKGKIPCIRLGSSIRYNWTNVLEVLEKSTDKKKSK